MMTDRDSQPGPLDLLTRMQAKAVERFELELNDMRTTMVAMATCCEQSLARLRDARWVSFEAASRLVADLAATSDLERARAASLAGDLEAARRELEAVRAEGRAEVEEIRAECRAEIDAARDAAIRYRDDTAASCLRELNAARELARSAVEAEARVREELTAMQARNQEIVDAQMLRLVELKRELELASSEADRARAAAETANREAVAKLGQRPAAELPRPSDAHRNHLTPEFDAIEAVLAGSPPVAAWERIA